MGFRSQISFLTSTLDCLPNLDEEQDCYLCRWALSQRADFVQENVFQFFLYFGILVVDQWVLFWDVSKWSLRTVHKILIIIRLLEPAL